MVGNDVQYVAARDEAFARNLQRIEREYRELHARGQPQGHSRRPRSHTGARRCIITPGPCHNCHMTRDTCRGHVRNLDTCPGLVT